MFDSKDYTVFVGNLEPGRVTHDLLLELFTQAGPVRQVSLKEDAAVAFVEFEDEESVVYACELLDDTPLFGASVSVRPRHGSRWERDYPSEAPRLPAAAKSHATSRNNSNNNSINNNLNLSIDIDNDNCNYNRYGEREYERHGDNWHECGGDGGGGDWRRPGNGPGNGHYSGQWRENRSSDSSDAPRLSHLPRYSDYGHYDDCGDPVGDQRSSPAWRRHPHDNSGFSDSGALWPPPPARTVDQQHRAAPDCWAPRAHSTHQHQQHQYSQQQHSQQQPHLLHSPLQPGQYQQQQHSQQRPWLSPHSPGARSARAAFRDRPY